jgi:hypothetical protein
MPASLGRPRNSAVRVTLIGIVGDSRNDDDDDNNDNNDDDNIDDNDDDDIDDN